MFLYAILLTFGIICQQSTEGAHLHPFQPSHCNGHNQMRIKRSPPSSQLHPDFDPNHRFPAGLPEMSSKNSDLKENPIYHEAMPPNLLHWDVKNHGDGAVMHSGDNQKESDIVGLTGLAHIHALAARAKARAAVNRAKVRARLHRPRLLEPTPEEFLHDDDDAGMDDPRNMFQVPDSVGRLKHNVRRKADQQEGNPSPDSIQQHFHPAKPAQQTSPAKPLQFNMGLKNSHHTFSGFDATHFNGQRPHINGQTVTKSDNLEKEPIIHEDRGSTHVAFPNLEIVVPKSAPNLARSAENYENEKFLPSVLPIMYNPQPEIRIHNIDNSEEVHQNRKPGFSIIPTNWKPPPDSNLYVQGDYESTNGQEPILAVLPGKWTRDYGFDTYNYNDYNVIPVTYNIPDDVVPSYYGRSAEPEEVAEDAVPEQFLGIKKQLQNWEDNPMVWRPNSTMSKQERVAEPTDQRHFHHHGHLHTFIQKHVKPSISDFSAGFQSQSSHFVQPAGHVKPGVSDFSSGFQSQTSHFVQPAGHVKPGVSDFSSGFQSQSSNFAQPAGHSGFSQSQNAGFFEHQVPETSGHTPIEHSSFLDVHGQGQKPGFSHHLSHGHSITINKQKTTVIAPSDFHKNIEIAQVTGSHNAVSQSQASGATPQHGFAANKFVPHDSNFQSAQVTGTHNAVSQSQASSAAHQQGFANGEFVPSNSKFQSAQVFGEKNDVSQSQRSAEPLSVGMESEGFLGTPYLINVPRRSDNLWRTHNEAPQKFIRKRSIEGNHQDDDYKTGSQFSKKVLDILKKQNNLLKEIQNSAKYDQELLFLTELGSNLLDDAEESLQSHSRAKRSVPILRLIVDPNAKLDVPKTLENMGTVARSSFENKRAPMYHVKNFVGSAKDAFLSTLRVVPQNFLIPSRYKIIDRESEGVEPCKLQSKISKRGDEEVRAISPSLLPRAKSLKDRIKERQNRPKEIPAQQPEISRQAETDPYGFSETYKKVGSMLRESVRSGQEALNHVGEMYHSTRKVLATARHSGPRILLSSMRIPSVQRHQPLLPKDDKIVMIAPKILQLKQEAVGAPHYSDNMNDLVGVGHVMDSLGISNPDAGKVDRRRIVFHPATVRRPIERPNLIERKPTLPNLQTRSNFADDEERPVKDTLRRYFVLADTLTSEAPEDNFQETMDALNNAREAVGASSLRDFIIQMKEGLSNIFKGKLEQARDKLNERISIPSANLDYKTVKGKISVESEGKQPVFFKFKANNPLYKKPSQDENNGGVKFSSNEQSLSNNDRISNNQNETVGAGLLLPTRLLKPFMGQPSKMERHQFFEELGDSEELSDDDKNEGGEEAPSTNSTPSSSDNNQEQIGAINPILFNETFQLYDNRSAFEFPAALNASRYANHTSGFNSTNDNSEVWKHKCNYARTATQKIPESSTNELNVVESTTKLSEEDVEEIHAEIKNTTIRSEQEKEEQEETTTERAVSETDVNSKNHNTQADHVSTSMKIGKKLLTPYMGKAIKKEMYTLFEPNDDSYEEDSDEDEYLGNPISRNPEQLQVLPTDDARKKNKDSFKKVAPMQQNPLGITLEHNLL